MSYTITGAQFDRAKGLARRQARRLSSGLPVALGVEVNPPEADTPVLINAIDNVDPARVRAWLLGLIQEGKDNE